MAPPVPHLAVELLTQKMNQATSDYEKHREENDNGRVYLTLPLTESDFKLLIVLTSGVGRKFLCWVSA